MNMYGDVYKIFVKNIFVIEEIFTKITKILDHGNLELYGIKFYDNTY